jgi:hypothetical protein
MSETKRDGNQKRSNWTALDASKLRAGPSSRAMA